MPFANFSGPPIVPPAPTGNHLVIDPPFAILGFDSLASGAARQSAYVENVNQRPQAKVTLEVRTGAVAPTNGTIVEIWLLRSDFQTLVGLVGDDRTGPTAGVYPVPPTLPRNATQIGALSVTATALASFKGTFVTEAPLGKYYGVAVVNRTDQALDSSGNTVIIETF